MNLFFSSKDLVTSISQLDHDFESSLLYCIVNRKHCRRKA